MFSKRLKSLRIKKGKKYTQQYVADYLGITRQAYGKYESGQAEPDLKTLDKLAELFDVSADYLMGRTDDESPLSIAFSHGKDPLTEEEEEYLERQLEEFRQWRKRFQQQDE